MADPVAATRQRLEPACLLLTFLLSACATAAMDFRPVLDLIKPGVDASWVYDFNRAAALGQRWGVDFVSTYGPYGYLISTDALATLPERRVIFEIVRVFLAAVSITLYLQTPPRSALAWRLPLAVLLAWALALQGREYRLLGVFYLLCLASVHFVEPWATAIRLLAGAEAGFLLLVKGSIGGTAVLAALAGACLGPWRRAPLRLGTAAAGIATGVVGGWYAHRGDLEGLAAQLRFSGEIASGYSSSMSLDPPEGWRQAFLFAAFVATLSASAALSRSRRARLGLAASLVPLFALSKHVFVRQDPQHAQVLLPFCVLLILVSLLDQAATGGSWVGLSLAGAASILLGPTWAFGEASPSLARLGEQLAAPWHAPGLESVRLLPDRERHRRHVMRRSRLLLTPLELPEDVAEQIADRRLDVYPWQTAFVAANPGRNWALRPSQASFGGYTPALDQLNARFLTSPLGPEVILWHWRAEEPSIDRRNVFWDEPLTMRAVLSRFELLREEPLLLRRRETERFRGERSLAQTRVLWDAWSEVPPSQGPLLLRLSWGASPLRSLARLLFRENPTYLDLRFASGKFLERRFVPDNAGSGLWINPPLLNPDDFKGALAGGLGERGVTAVRIRGSGASLRTGDIGLSWLELVPEP